MYSMAKGKKLMVCKWTEQWDDVTLRRMIPTRLRADLVACAVHAHRYILRDSYERNIIIRANSAAMLWQGIENALDPERTPEQIEHENAKWRDYKYTQASPEPRPAPLECDPVNAPYVGCYCKTCVSKRAVRESIVTPQEESSLHPEDFCMRCKRPNFSWFVENTVWNEVMRTRPNRAVSCFENSWSIVCPNCFVELAELGGLKHVSWQLAPDKLTS
jgi:hypothetical protein